MKTADDKRKISVQMWEPLLHKFNELCSKACLNRDAYFDLVLADEAPMLLSELAGRQNSPAARKYVKRCLLELQNLRPVSFSLRRSTAEAVDQACDEANVWRDVFINRITYLLVVRTSSLEWQWDIEFKHYRNAIFEDGWEIKRLLLGPRLIAIADFLSDDPFAGMRAALRAAYPDTDGALHLQPLGIPGAARDRRGLTGFCTYLADELVPGTESNAEQDRMVQMLLESLLEDGGEQRGAADPTKASKAKQAKVGGRRVRA
jgi:hypothetical protein